MSRQRPLIQFLLGVAFGIVSAIVGVVLSLLTGIVAIVVVGFVGLLMPGYAFMSGGLLGMGLTWMVMLAGSLSSCESPCGANYLPLAIISVALTGVGFGLVLFTYRQRR